MPIELAEGLMEGPSQKNKALLDIETVLQALFEERVGSTEHKPTQAVIFELNADRQLMARCPEGRSYNLSLALKHANLEYFLLRAKDENLLKECAHLLHEPDDLAESKELQSSIGSPEEDEEGRLVIYALEAKAIKSYTSDAYKHLNTLLRGQPIEFKGHSNDLKQYFVQVLLIISGVNKNIFVHPGEEDKSSSLVYRRDNQLPVDLLAKMQYGDGEMRRAGLFSTSEKEGFLLPFYETPHIFQFPQGHQQSIQHVSMEQDEAEVLYPPSAMKLTFVGTNEKKERVYKGIMIHGKHAEQFDQYRVDLALATAHQILKNPYRDAPQEVQEGIQRPNHALAHHVRVVEYVPAVIDYFKAHATKILSDFCQALSHEDIQLIQVLMAFSKTGRESEIGFHDDPSRYQAYQDASVAHLEEFMRQTLRLSEEKIGYYAEILRYMGNPDFSAKATGTEEERQAKIAINHIISLAHKLDLPRCYNRTQFENSVAIYGETPLESERVGIVSCSEKQREHWEALKRFSLRSLQYTGEPIHPDFNATPLDGLKRFKSCNSQVDISRAYCAQAYHETFPACDARKDTYSWLSLQLQLGNMVQALSTLQEILETRPDLIANDSGMLLAFAFQQKAPQAILALLISNSRCLSYQDSAGKNLLYKALYHRLPEPLALEVIAKLPPAQLQADGPCLGLAAENGYLNCMNALIAAGADVNHCSQDGWTPLHAAAKANHFTALQILLEAGANPDENLAYRMLKKTDEIDNTALQDFLIAKIINLPNVDHHKFLLLAAEKGHIHCLRILIEAGADIHRPDASGRTALCWAVEKNHLNCVTFLMGKGALLTEASAHQLLAPAKLHNDLSLIDKLIPHLPEEDKNDLLSYAAQAGHYSYMEKLIALGARITPANPNKHPPLYYAIRYGQTECAKILIRQGAIPTPEFASHILPKAKERNDLELICLLIPHLWLSDKNSLLAWAAKQGNAACIKILLASGAETESYHHPTPLSIAVTHNHLECAKILMSSGASLSSMMIYEIFRKAKAANDLELFRLLMPHLQPDVKNHLLVRAAEEEPSGWPYLKLLISQGAELSKAFAEQLLSKAKNAPDIELVILLIPHLKKEKKEQLLVWAIQQEHVACIALLIKGQTKIAHCSDPDLKKMLEVLTRSPFDPNAGVCLRKIHAQLPEKKRCTILKAVEFPQTAHAFNKNHLVLLGLQLQAKQSRQCYCPLFAPPPNLAWLHSLCQADQNPEPFRELSCLQILQETERRYPRLLSKHVLTSSPASEASSCEETKSEVLPVSYRRLPLS